MKKKVSTEQLICRRCAILITVFPQARGDIPSTIPDKASYFEVTNREKSGILISISSQLAPCTLMNSPPQVLKGGAHGIYIQSRRRTIQTIPAASVDMLRRLTEIFPML